MTNSIWEPRSSAPWLSNSLPALRGEPITFAFRTELHAGATKVDASAYLRKRRVVLDAGLSASELQRVTAHELFHFVWWRLGNPARWAWEELIATERARGEAGWSAEWRKQALTVVDHRNKTRRWREYVCEAFCDSAAAIYAGPSQVTLAPRFLARRRAWFVATLEGRPISI